MPSDTNDITSALHRIHQLATQAASGSPDAMRSSLQEIAMLASGHVGDSPEPSDIPETENQSL